MTPVVYVLGVVGNYNTRKWPVNTRPGLSEQTDGLGPRPGTNEEIPMRWMLMAGLLAFVVLPVMQGRDEGLDIFASLCRALGLAPPDFSSPKNQYNDYVFERRVDFTTDLEEQLPTVTGDPGALSHAVMNLCINALDAMPDGGAIVLVFLPLMDAN